MPGCPVQDFGGGTGWDANRGSRHIERPPSNTLNHQPKHNLGVRIPGTKDMGDTRLTRGHYLSSARAPEVSRRSIITW